MKRIRFQVLVSHNVITTFYNQIKQNDIRIKPTEKRSVPNIDWNISYDGADVEGLFLGKSTIDHHKRTDIRLFRKEWEDGKRLQVVSTKSFVFTPRPLRHRNTMASSSGAWPSSRVPYNTSGRWTLVSDLLSRSVRYRSNMKWVQHRHWYLQFVLADWSHDVYYIIWYKFLFKVEKKARYEPHRHPLFLYTAFARPLMVGCKAVPYCSRWNLQWIRPILLSPHPLSPSYSPATDALYII